MELETVRENQDFPSTFQRHFYYFTNVSSILGGGYEKELKNQIQSSIEVLEANMCQLGDKRVLYLVGSTQLF
jgi:hypothetical protein